MGKEQQIVLPHFDSDFASSNDDVATGLVIVSFALPTICVGGATRVVEEVTF